MSNDTGFADTWQGPNPPCFDVTSFENTITLNRSETVNITWEGLPPELEPPYNITQTIRFRNNSWNEGDLPSSLEFLIWCDAVPGQEQIDTQYLEYTGAPVYNETRIAQGGNFTPLSFGFVLYAANPVRYTDGEPAADQPYWQTANYTIADAESGPSAGEEGEEGDSQQPSETSSASPSASSAPSATGQPGAGFVEHAPPVKLAIAVLGLLGAATLL